MDVKEFFYNGGVVKCRDRTESDVVIHICQQEGLSVYADHDPNGVHHGVYWNSRYELIGFQRNGTERWRRGTPFAEWIERYGHPINPTPVEDLI